MRGEEQRLRQPSPGISDVLRPRLLDALSAAVLDERSQDSLVSISAPAGSGKTRLLAAWVQQVKTRQPEPVIAWLTCHRSDHDLTPLRRALLRAAPPALAEALLEVPLLEDENTVRALSSALERHDGLVIMVLDDAHEVRGTALNHSVAALIAAVPPNVRFIVANRGAPPFRIARLRLDGRVLDLGPADLAFTRDEATRYFEGRRTLSEVELDDVMARTEGWAAAFRLLELLPGDGDAGGESRATTEYLLQEIFEEARPDMQSFLVRTAVPEVFSADLAAVLTGQDPHDALRRLEMSNVLFDHVRGDTDVYRYHALLREFLLEEAHRLDAELRGRLERVCAEWFASHSDYVPAVRHAIASGDQRVLWLLLANYGLRLVLMGHAEVAAQGLEALDAAVQITPAIKDLRAAVEFTLGNAAPALAVARVLESAQPFAAAAPTATRPAATGLATGGAVEDVLSAIDASGSAVEYGEAGIYLRLRRGTAELYAGRLKDAEVSAYEAWVVARRAGLGGAEMQAAAIRCSCAVYGNRLDEAVRWAEIAETRAAELDLQSNLSLLATRLWRGWAAFRRGEHVEADEPVMAAARSLADGPNPIQARVARGLLALFQRDDDRHNPSLLAIIRQCLPPDRTYPGAPQWHCLSVSVVQRVLLDEGDHDAARATVDAAESLLGPLPDFGVLRGVHHLMLGEHSRARAAVAAVAANRVVPRHPVAHTMAWLVEASVNSFSGSHAAAQAALSRAMRFALESGDVRPFTDFAGVVNELLTAGHPRSGTLGAFGEVILRATAGAPSGPPLTLRERDVVAELGSLRTISEIARDMSLSPNTIKTHLKSIYGKLSVENRRQAVAQARANGIL